MDEEHEYVLIKSNSQPSGFRISDKETRGFIIFEDIEDANELVKTLLSKGVEIFETEEDFQNKYPLLTREQRLAMGMDFWLKNIPKEKWTKDVKDYFEKNKRQ